MLGEPQFLNLPCVLLQASLSHPRTAVSWPPRLQCQYYHGIPSLVYHYSLCLSLRRVYYRMWGPCQCPWLPLQDSSLGSISSITNFRRSFLSSRHLQLSLLVPEINAFGRHMHLSPSSGKRSGGMLQMSIWMGSKRAQSSCKQRGQGLSSWAHLINVTLMDPVLSLSCLRNPQERHLRWQTQAEFLIYNCFFSRKTQLDLHRSSPDGTKPSTIWKDISFTQSALGKNINHIFLKKNHTGI